MDLTWLDNLLKDNPGTSLMIKYNQCSGRYEAHMLEGGNSALIELDTESIQNLLERVATHF